MDKKGAICGVKLEDGTTIDADAFIVACGPWTDAARSWFGAEGEQIPRMMGVKVSYYMLQCINITYKKMYLSDVIMLVS